MPPDLAPSRSGEERRREIVRVAIDVFGEHGFAGARVDEVARRVGIRRPSILYHFPDKTRLHRAAIAEVIREITARVAAIDAEADDRIGAIVDAWIDFVIHWPNAARLLLRQLVDSDPVELREDLSALETLFGLIAAALDEPARPEDGKPVDVGEFALMLASTSLVWVAGQRAVQRALGIDTLAPQAIQRHRRMLHGLIHRQWSAAREVDGHGTAQA